MRGRDREEGRREEGSEGRNGGRRGERMVDWAKNEGKEKESSKGRRRRRKKLRTGKGRRRIPGNWHRTRGGVDRGGREGGGGGSSSQVYSGGITERRVAVLAALSWCSGGGAREGSALGPPPHRHTHCNTHHLCCSWAMAVCSQMVGRIGLFLITVLVLTLLFITPSSLSSQSSPSTPRRDDDNTTATPTVSEAMFGWVELGQVGWELLD